MILILQRKYKKGTYTIGNLYVDGVWHCNTLEDCDRGLRKSMPLQEIQEKKVYGETAIPVGEYLVDMNTVSPKYSKVAWFNSVTKGRMPRLVGVPGFEGILIHTGNTPADTFGCILVGYNTVKGKLSDSRKAFQSLYAKMRSAADRGDKIYIKIG